MHRSLPRADLRQTLCSLLLLISLIVGALPPAAAQSQARPLPAGLPALAAPAPLGAPALSPIPAGLSDLHTSVERDISVQVAWMSDQSYDIEIEYGPTRALGQHMRPTTLRAERLTGGGYSNALTMPTRRDLHFYRLRALKPGTRRTAALSAVQRVGQVVLSSAQQPGHDHHQHAMLAQPAPAAALQTTTPPPSMDSSQQYCEFGGPGGGPLGNPRPPCSSGVSEADPVTMGDGAWYMNVPCLELGGAGLPIFVGLRYSTHMWFDNIGMSSIGRGWTVGYGRRLSFDNLTVDSPSRRYPSLMLTLETGERWPYYANTPDDGTYTAGDGNYTALVRNLTSGEYTLTYRNGTKDIFAADGLLTRVEDRFGNQTLISFAVVGTVGRQTIRNARTNQAIVLDHELVNGTWRLARIRDAVANGSPIRQITLAYGTTGNDAGRLTKVTDAAGRVYTFAYDSAERIDTYYDPNNNPAVVTAPLFMKNTYTGHRVLKQTLPNGTTVDFGFAYINGPYEARLTVTYNKNLPDQRVISYELLTRSNGGRAGRITAATVPNTTNAVRMRYDDQGNLEWTTDPLGRRTQYLYDSRGNLREQRVYTGLGSYDATLMESNSFGQMTRLIQPAGAVTEWSYNATTGALETITRRASLNGTPIVQTTTVETAPVTINGVAVQTGLITGVRLPDGTWNTQTYDSRGYPAVSTYDANYGGNTGRLALTETTIYDWRGYLTSLTNMQGVQTSYEYASGAGQYGPLGWASAAVFDSASGGRAIRTDYSYDLVGNITQIVEDAGSGRLNATWQYSYDPVGTAGDYDITAATDPLGQVMQYQYTAYGDLELLTQLSPTATQATRSTAYSYTPEGWLKQITLQDSRVVETHAYNLMGQTVAITDAQGLVNGYGYDAKGRVGFSTDQLPSEVNLATGAAATASSGTSAPGLAIDGNTGTLTRTAAEPNAWWQVDLGASYDLSRLSLSGSPSETANFSIFVSDTPFSSTDPEQTKLQPGVSWEEITGQIGSPTNPNVLALSGTGRYVRVQLRGSGVLALYEVAVEGYVPLPASAEFTAMAYDANDRLAVSTIRVDATTTRTLVQRSFDGFNRLATSQDGEGNRSTLRYDNSRNWLTLSTAGSNVAAEQLQTQYNYDALGRLTQQIVDPGTGRQNLTTSFFYSATGSTDRWNLQRLQDPRGNSTRYRYNSFGLLEQTIDAASTPGVWSYAYDNLGALTQITPPRGAATIYTRDLLQRPTSLSRNGQIESWIYNADGSLASHLDFAGQSENYSYDPTGRLASVDRAGTNADGSYTYFDNDLLKTATSKPNGMLNETTSYTYDPRRRLETRTRAGRTVSYSYNLDDTLSTLTYWNRGAVSYGYDNAGRVSSTTPWSGQPTSYTYRSTDLLKQIVRPVGNSISTSFGYDTASRLTSISHTQSGTPIETLQYVRDANSNVTQMTDQYGTATYQYDVLNRLTEAQYPAIPSGPPAATQTFGYDAVGNRSTDDTLGMTTGPSGPAWSDAAGWNDPKYYRTLGYPDINGDGKEDVCARGSAGVSCFLSNGSGFPTAVAGPAWSDAAGWGSAQYYLTIEYPDINGDGKEDVCGRGTAGVNCFLSNGSGFPTAVAGPAWSDAGGWNVASRYLTIRYPDINGDGKADICGRAAAGMECYLSNGSGFATAVTGPAWSDADGWSSAQYYQTIRIGDINGDGKDDLCARGTAGVSCFLSNGSGFPTAVAGPAWSDAGGWTGPQYYLTIRLADINGDGKDDICGRESYGVDCYLSNGSAFATYVAGPEMSDALRWNEPQYYLTIRTPDINNDGKADICGRGIIGIYCFPSTGSGFAPYLLGPEWSDANGWAAAASYLTIRYPDINGDGTQDACGRGPDGVVCATSGLRTAHDSSDRITNSGYIYDLNGNLIATPDGTSYTYDAANRLTRSVKAGVTTDYFYDALGNLVRQKITNGSAVATFTFMLDESGELPVVLGEIRSDGSETLYAYGPEGLTARRDLSGTSDQRSYPLLDGLGSIRHWTSASGSVGQSMVYDAWGVLRAVSGTNPAGGAGLRNGPGFTGEPQRDDGTVHLRARVDQPGLGRFLQRDRLAGFLDRPQSLNRYAYAENNPLLNTDPSGNIAIPAGGGLIAACAANPVLCAGVVIVGGGVVLCTLYCDRLFQRDPAPAVAPPADPTPRPAAPSAGLRPNNREGQNNIVQFRRPGKGNPAPGPDDGGERVPPSNPPGSGGGCSCREGYEDVLDQLGVDRSDVPSFLRGDPVLYRFRLPGQSGIQGIGGGLQMVGKRLVAGIMAIEDDSGRGARLFGRFRDLARQLAELCDADELELYGSNVINPKILKLLTRQGFQPSTIQNPASTNLNNRLDVLSKIERLRP